MNTNAKLTILNSMAGSDFEQALDRHLEWKLSVIDLKDAIYGKRSMICCHRKRSKPPV